MRRRRCLAMAGALLLASCNQEAGPPAPTVDATWVRLPVVSGRPGAAYFKLQGGPDAARLTAITSPQIGRIELHESAMSGGVMRMSPMQGVDLPPHQTVEFTPAGKHAMLFEIDPKVKPGDRLRLTFSFEPRRQLVVEAEVRAAGDGGHEH